MSNEYKDWLADQDEFRSKFEKLAKDNGAELSSIADRILRVKARAIDEYACPCYPDDIEHYCISQLCKTEIMTKGRCHCGLFVKKEI